MIRWGGLEFLKSGCLAFRIVGDEKMFYFDLRNNDSRGMKYYRSDRATAEEIILWDAMMTERKGRQWHQSQVSGRMSINSSRSRAKARSR